MFKDARQLAREAMISHLEKIEDPEVTEELLDQVLDMAWAHQSDPEPRRSVREKLKEQIARSAILQARRGGELEA